MRRAIRLWGRLLALGLTNEFGLRSFRSSNSKRSEKRFSDLECGGHAAALGCTSRAATWPPQSRSLRLRIARFVLPGSRRPHPLSKPRIDEVLERDVMIEDTGFAHQPHDQLEVSAAR